VVEHRQSCKFVKPGRGYVFEFSFLNAIELTPRGFLHTEVMAGNIVMARPERYCSIVFHYHHSQEITKIWSSVNIQWHCRPAACIRKTVFGSSFLPSFVAARRSTVATLFQVIAPGLCCRLCSWSRWIVGWSSLGVRIQMFDILQLGAYCASHADVSNVLQVGRIIFTGDLETNNNICMARTYHRINIDCEIILIYGPLW